jgi:hypothetical protein
MSKWNKARLQSLIDGKIEESSSLEYKAAKALEDNESISIDVSSFANASGGVIIYGISEHKEKKHVPERLDPVDRMLVRKEWLEQIISSNIYPRIDNLQVIPVSDDENGEKGYYVIEVPTGSTAHQASDKRYYRSHNFQKLPMLDQEIRDVMNRSKHPDIEMDLRFAYTTINYKTVIRLESWLRNRGALFATYVNYTLKIPLYLITDHNEWEYAGQTEEIQNVRYAVYEGENIVQDVVETILKTTGAETILGPGRFAPILPKRSFRGKLIEIIKPVADFADHGDLKIYWSVYADNAPVKEGAVRILDLKIR